MAEADMVVRIMLWLGWIIVIINFILPNDNCSFCTNLRVFS